MKRRSLTQLQRVRIFDAASGICHLCKCRIFAGSGERWEVEHIKPLWLGGDDAEHNMAPAHERCHIAKTSEEAPVRAKSNRVRAKYLGARRTKYRWPAGKDSAWKRKMSGEVIRRDK